MCSGESRGSDPRVPCPLFVQRKFVVQPQFVPTRSKTHCGEHNFQDPSLTHFLLLKRFCEELREGVSSQLRRKRRDLGLESIPGAQFPHSHLPPQIRLNPPANPGLMEQPKESDQAATDNAISNNSMQEHFAPLAHTPGYQHYCEGGAGMAAHLLDPPYTRLE